MNPLDSCKNRAAFVVTAALLAVGAGTLLRFGAGSRFSVTSASFARSPWPSPGWDSLGLHEDGRRRR